MLIHMVGDKTFMCVLNIHIVMQKNKNKICTKSVTKIKVSWKEISKNYF